jgi:hypothetical protein
MIFYNEALVVYPKLSDVMMRTQSSESYGHFFWWPRYVMYRVSMAIIIAWHSFLSLRFLPLVLMHLPLIRALVDVTTTFLSLSGANWRRYARD